jgi:hypothetical protein
MVLSVVLKRMDLLLVAAYAVGDGHWFHEIRDGIFPSVGWIVLGAPT